MEINDDALDFCQNLLAYTYNIYFQRREGLQVDFTTNRVGEAVLYVMFVHNATFKRLLLQDFPTTCKSQVEFLRCMVGHSSKIIRNPCQAFLASAALLVVYMYIGFDKKCYRFLQTSSLCLYIILMRILSSKGYIRFSRFYRDLVNYSDDFSVQMKELRELAISKVEAAAPESVQTMQRMLVERMQSRELRHDLTHLLCRTAPHSGSVQEIEIETVVNGDFSFDTEDGTADGLCSECDTHCRMNYEMHILDHQQR